VALGESEGSSLEGIPVTLPVDLPLLLAQLGGALENARTAGASQAEELDIPAFLSTLRAVYINAALEQAGNNPRAAAELLGLPIDGLLMSPALSIRS
jgi:hypothetical protein